MIKRKVSWGQVTQRMMILGMVVGVLFGCSDDLDGNSSELPYAGHTLTILKQGSHTTSTSSAAEEYGEGMLVVRAGSRLMRVIGHLELKDAPPISLSVFVDDELWFSRDLEKVPGRNRTLNRQKGAMWFLRHTDDSVHFWLQLRAKGGKTLRGASIVVIVQTEDESVMLSEEIVLVAPDKVSVSLENSCHVAPGGVARTVLSNADAATEHLTQHQYDVPGVCGLNVPLPQTIPGGCELWSTNGQSTITCSYTNSGSVDMDGLVREINASFFGRIINEETPVCIEAWGGDGGKGGYTRVFGSTCSGGSGGQGGYAATEQTYAKLQDMLQDGSVAHLGVGRAGANGANYSSTNGEGGSGGASTIFSDRSLADINPARTNPRSAGVFLIAGGGGGGGGGAEPSVSFICWEGTSGGAAGEVRETSYYGAARGADGDENKGSGGGRGLGEGGEVCLDFPSSDGRGCNGASGIGGYGNGVRKASNNECIGSTTRWQPGVPEYDWSAGNGGGGSGIYVGIPIRSEARGGGGGGGFGGGAGGCTDKSTDQARGGGGAGSFGGSDIYSNNPGAIVEPSCLGRDVKPNETRDGAFAITFTLDECPEIVRRMYFNDGTKIMGADLTVKCTSASVDNITTIIADTGGGGGPANDLIGLAADMLRDRLYWSNGDSIQYSTLEGDEIQTLIGGLHGVTGFALDHTGEFVYWLESDELSTLWRARLSDGSDDEQLCVSQSTNMFWSGLAIDEAGGTLYWTGDGTRGGGNGAVWSARLASLEGLSPLDPCPTIGRLDVDAAGIALDLEEEYFYWTDPDWEWIGRANFDGTYANLMAIETDPSVTKLGIDVNARLGLVVWAENTKQIKAAPRNGGDTFVLISDINPSDVIVPDCAKQTRSFYFNDERKILRADLTVDCDSSSVDNIETIMPDTGGSTEWGGYVGLAADPAQNHLYWANGDVIKRSTLDGKYVELLLTDRRGVFGLALDRPSGYMYWAEAGESPTELDTLWRARYSDGSGLEKLCTSQNANFWWADVAVDEVSRQIYWTGNGYVEFGAELGIWRAPLASLEGLPPEEPCPGEKIWEVSTTAVAVNSQMGSIFWTDPDLGWIGRANLDGTDADWMAIEADPFVHQYGLDVSSDLERVLWAEGFRRIKSGKPDGSDVTILVPGINPTDVIVIDAPTFELEVLKAGSGTGVVTSDSGDIDCGDNCSESFLGGRLVELTAAASDGSWFSGWTGEGCDDGRVMMVADRVCTATFDEISSKIAFVTSTLHKGTIGGLDGADAICGTRAAEAGLPGDFRAWLADASGSPSTRFVKSLGPYLRTDEKEIAESYDDLVEYGLTRPLDVDEWGEMVKKAPGSAWTNVLSNGTLHLVESSCDGWTSDKSGSAFTGDYRETGPDWTQTPRRTKCSRQLRLYCFEQ